MHLILVWETAPQNRLTKQQSTVSTQNTSNRTAYANKKFFKEEMFNFDMLLSIVNL
jgi:hypothetical protein